MAVLRLELPFPPSVNHYKKIGALIKTKTGKLYQQRCDSPKTIEFYYKVYRAYKLTMPPEWEKYARNEEIAFDVKVDLHPPDKRRRDIDNSLKVLLDSLVHAKAIYDDSQINRLFVQKLHNVTNGQVIIHISVIGDLKHESLTGTNTKEK